MPTFNATLKRLLRDESGVTSIEYALIGALLAMAIVGGVSTLGESVESLFSMIASKMPSMP
ncbi:Flp family type IVb pilin [Cupriavidus basilensis]